MSAIIQAYPTLTHEQLEFLRMRPLNTALSFEAKTAAIQAVGGRNMLELFAIMRVVPEYPRRPEIEALFARYSIHPLREFTPEEFLTARPKR